MKILKQISILLGICIAGSVVTRFLPVPFPASVAAMILLLILLGTGLLKLHQIEQTADFLLQNMAFFFIPAAVGIAADFGLFKNYLLQLAVVLVITTLLTFAATAFTVSAVIRLTERRRQRKGQQP